MNMAAGCSALTCCAAQEPGFNPSPEVGRGGSVLARGHFVVRREGGKGLVFWFSGRERNKLQALRLSLRKRKSAHCDNDRRECAEALADL